MKISLITKVFYGTLYRTMLAYPAARLIMPPKDMFDQVLIFLLAVSVSYFDAYHHYDK